jgi:uncharacterized protein
MSETHLALTPGQLQDVLAVLHAFAPSHQAMAFGSRVRVGSDAHPLKPHADLDIALTGRPLAPHEMFALRDGFSESDLPFRVDVLMREDLPAHWLNAIPWVALPSKQ